MNFETDSGLTVPVINDEADDALDQEVLKALDEDDTPTESQTALVKMGGYLATKSDRSAFGGGPSGKAVDDISGIRVGLIGNMDQDREGVPSSAKIELAGKNDPDLRRAFAKYFSTQYKNANDLANRMEAAFREAAQAKKDRAAAAKQAQKGDKTVNPDMTTRTAEPVLGQQAAPAPTYVDVTYDYGNGDVVYARYTKATIHQFMLILVVSKDDRWRGVTFPRLEVPVTVEIEGLPNKVRAQYAGISFPHNGDILCVLFIERESE